MVDNFGIDVQSMLHIFLRNLLLALSLLGIYEDSVLNKHENALSRHEIGRLVCNVNHQLQGSLLMNQTDLNFVHPSFYINVKIVIIH